MFGWKCKVPIVFDPGAQNQIRTGDLALTKGVLYQLSYLGEPERVKKRKGR